MGIKHFVSEWLSLWEAKNIAEMEALDSCPDCKGKGFHFFVSNEFAFNSSVYDCPGCNGSGLFTDWSEMKHE